MNLPGIENIEWSAEDKVLMRVDFNVPLDSEGNVSDDTRIRSALPSIKYLTEKGCNLILCSHLGRPNGVPTEKFTLFPVAKRLQELLNEDVIFINKNTGPTALNAVKNLTSGQVAVIENLRFNNGEKSNNPHFVKELAKLGTAYVNDAFGVLHRKHASVCGLAKSFDKKAVGFLIEKEHKALNSLFESDKKPMTAILGGSKVSDKIILMENLTHHASDIIIGGAMAYTFLKAMGKPVGQSKVETSKLEIAEQLIEKAQMRDVTLHLPIDHVTTKYFSEDAEAEIHEEIPEDQLGMDIGPKTIEAYAKVLSKAKSVFWNGPMGVFEWSHFSNGTKSIADELTQLEAYTVIGGGDSAAAVHKFGRADGIDHISTGGGASLALLEGDILPGLAAFVKKGGRK